MTTNGHRAVALDMDGVVVDGMRFHVPAWQEAFRRVLGIEVTSHRIFLGEGVRGEELIDQVASEMGCSLTDTDRVQIYTFKREYFKKIFRAEPMSGARELVMTLKNMKYPLALVTGTVRETAEGALSRLGLLTYFDSVICGDDVTQGKPAPEPYLCAIKSLGASPAYSLAIENAPAGIASAKAAGMACVAVESSLDANFLDQADRVLPDHGELLKLLLQEHADSFGLGPWHL